MTETTTAPALPLTEAQRYLADNREQLEAALTSRTETLTAEAEAMTKDDLRARLDEYNATAERWHTVNVPNKTAPKGEYVEAVVRMRLKGTDEQGALDAARTAAGADRRLDWAMRALQEGRTTVLAETAEALADAATDPAKAGYALLYHLEWHADDDMTTLAAARLADGYFDARAKGVEPSAYAGHLAKEAITKIVRTVDSGSNLRLTARGLHDLCEANAHRIVLSKILGHLDEATQELIGYVL